MWIGPEIHITQAQISMMPGIQVGKLKTVYKTKAMTETQTEEQGTPYEQGQNAATEGKHESDNPFDIKEQGAEWHEWANGLREKYSETAGDLPKPDKNPMGHPDWENDDEGDED